MNRRGKLSGPQGLKPSSLLVLGGAAEEAAEKVDFAASAPKGRLISKNFSSRGHTLQF